MTKPIYPQIFLAPVRMVGNVSGVLVWHLLPWCQVYHSPPNSLKPVHKKRVGAASELEDWKMKEQRALWRRLEEKGTRVSAVSISDKAQLGGCDGIGKALFPAGELWCSPWEDSQVIKQLSLWNNPRGEKLTMKTDFHINKQKEESELKFIHCLQ